jgi:CRISPR-associated protein Cas5t
MAMLCIYFQAPFAVFRTFTAGSFRPTAPFMTPSAAYGLLLNLAGIEMRDDDGASEMTLIRSGLPSAMIALGALEMPLQHSAYQQLHNYPVGNTGKDHAPNTKGNKYNITPARRSFLSNLRGYLCLKGNDELAAQVLDGLAGNRPRKYGLPFLGDNNFLPDRIEAVERIEPAHWFVKVEPDDDGGIAANIARLTVTIDRADMSKTQSRLFRVSDTVSADIPSNAWVEVGYA